MSEYIHTAIVVTGCDHNANEQGVRVIVCAIQKAEALGLLCTPIAAGRNGYRSFMVAPSGSAGGFHPSSAGGEEARKVFVHYLREQGTRLEWVEVTFGREHGRAEIGADCTDASSTAAMKWNARTDPRRAETDGAAWDRYKAEVAAADPLPRCCHISTPCPPPPQATPLPSGIVWDGRDSVTFLTPQPTGTCPSCRGPVFGENVPGVPCVNCCIETAESKKETPDHE